MTASKGEILCIHYYFPPLDSTAVIRNYHFSNSFAVRFEKVHVLTSDNHRSFSNQIRQHPENLYRYDISTQDYRYFLSKKSNKDSHQATTKKTGRFFKWLLKIQKSFPFNLFLAEGNLLYIFRAYRKAKKLISARNITTVYSSFGPYSDHYVAYLIKRKFPELKWIADFRDLQIEPIYKNVVWKGLQIKVEQKVLSKADLVTCISEGFVRQLEAYSRPTKAILRGVALREPVTQYPTFTISYTGSLYFDYRDPRPLFKQLQKLIEDGDIRNDELSILYAGRDHEKFSSWVSEYELDQCFTNKGMIAQDEAKEIQNRSHINLLLTSSSTELTGVMTGKVFEYFESRNPTLCLISGVKDPEFEALFQELNAGVVVYSPEISSNKMRDFILSKFTEWKSSQRVSSTINTSFIKSKYSWDAQVTNMLDGLSD